MARVFPVLAMVAALTLTAAAQDRKDAPRYTGSGEWLVIKASLQDFTGKGDQRVADFAREDEARKEASRLNEAEKEWTKWTYTYRRRAQDDPGPAAPVVPGGPMGAPIKQQDLKFVDPGAMKKSDVKVPSLAGRKGTGNIGTSEVTIEFGGEGESGEFVVTGDLMAKGKWRQLGKSVLMVSGKATFDGTINGDKLGGVVRTKESGESREWNVKLTAGRAAGGLTNTAWVTRGQNGRDVTEYLIVFTDTAFTMYSDTYIGAKLADQPWTRFEWEPRTQNKFVSGTWKAKGDGAYEATVNYSVPSVEEWKVEEGKLKRYSQGKAWQVYDAVPAIKTRGLFPNSP